MDSSQRRSFLARLNAGAAAVAAVALGRAAQAQTRAAAKFEAARHEKDDWMDIAAKHRLLFDTISAEMFGKALMFGGNFLRVNRVDYGLPESDVAVIIVARHRSAAFGYNDAMWAKYGAAISKRIEYVDPKTHEAPKVNTFLAPADAGGGEGGGGSIEALVKQGVQFAVCASATRAIAGTLARATGGETDAIFAELGANLVKNARLVPAGIVAVNRAQERGYTLALS